MQTYAVVVYVISDEILKLLGCKDEQQAKMSNAEVMTFAILAAKHFHSNYKMARYICKNLRLFPTILSNSRLNRRIHLIPWECWNAVFRFLALFFKQTSTNQTFVVDSFPVSWCQKNRIDKRKFFFGETVFRLCSFKKTLFLRH